MSADHDHAGATDDPTWYYTEHGDAVHTVQYCPALSSSTPIPAQSYYDVPGTRPICKICKRRSDANPYEDLERYVCTTLPLDLEHVPNKITHEHDARLVGAVGPDDDLLVIGAVEAPATTSIEIKTCCRRIDDNGSENGYRRGRFRFVPQQHTRLKRAGGWYLLCVLDEGRIVEHAMVYPARLDPDLEDRWTATSRTNYHDEEARVPWSAVIDPERLSNGGDEP